MKDAKIAEVLQEMLPYLGIEPENDEKDEEIEALEDEIDVLEDNIEILEYEIEKKEQYISFLESKIKSI